MLRKSQMVHTYLSLRCGLLSCCLRRLRVEYVHSLARCAELVCARLFARVRSSIDPQEPCQPRGFRSGRRSLLKVTRNFEEIGSGSDLAKKFGLALSTLSSLAGQRAQITRRVQRFGHQQKGGENFPSKLEVVLQTWFRKMTAAGVNIDGEVLREKAADVALSL